MLSALRYAAPDNAGKAGSGLASPIEIVRLEAARFEEEKHGLKSGVMYEVLADGLPVDRFLIDPALAGDALERFLEDRARAARRNAASLRGRPFLPAQGRPSATVVICTRDRPEELRRCLASFATQEQVPDELIVVDNASRTDETRQVALALGATYLREDRPGLDYARNTGARAARSDLIIFTDDDVILHPQWLKRMASAFTEPEIEAVTGLVLAAELQTQAQWIFETQWGFARGFRRRDFTPESYRRRMARAFPSWEVGAGASMGFRRSVFERIGYFDERLDVGAAGCSGDSEYWNRILHFGGTCRYEPSAVAYHFHRRDVEGLRKQVAAYMSGHTAALLVQLENTGARGNRRYLSKTLPKALLRKLASRLVRGPMANNFMVVDEIIGCLRGIRFYRNAPRPEALHPHPLVRRPFHPMAVGATGEAPLVSVVVPAYNAERTLSATLASALAQSYPALEIIVVDDGSSDATAAIAQQFMARDRRVRLIRQANGGLANARNSGIRASTGAFIAPLDADDLWHPRKIERQLHAMLRSGEACGLAYGEFAYIDGDDTVLDYNPVTLPEGDVFETMLRQNFIGNGSSPLLRKSALLEAGLYDPGLREQGAQGCEDLLMQIRVAENHDFAVSHTVLTGYRISPSGMSNRIGQMIQSHRLVIEPFAKAYPWLRDGIEAGHRYMVMWYAMQAIRGGRLRLGFSTLMPLLKAHPRSTLRDIGGHLMASGLVRLRHAARQKFPDAYLD